MNPREMAQRILGTLVRCTVSLVNSTTKMQTLQLGLLSDEPKDGMEHFEPYGYTASPLDGAEGIAGFMGGDRSHGVVLVVADRRYRLTGLEPGEVALYTDEGTKIVLKRGRVVEIDCDEYRVNTKVYSVTTETFALNAAAATSSCAIEAPEMIVGGVPQTTHRHVEHGDVTGVPIA